MRFAVMGGGSWGTAFSIVLADAGNDVALWTREPAAAESITSSRENPRYHPGITLPQAIRATTDPAAALDGAEVVVLAVPSQTLRENLSGWLPHLRPDAVLVSLMKGIELGTTYRMTEVVVEVAQVSHDQVAVVSGPNLAREIAQRQPAATTVACADEAVARMLVDCTTVPYFRPYWTTDVVGTELGGSVKNVIALANGMVVGLGLGENAQASLITRGLAEMTRLGVALGAQPMTFLGLAGIGDLVATCSSPLSRNRSFGELLGQGLSTEEATARSTQTCEGVKSCQPLLQLARAHDVDMPISEQVVDVVHHGASVGDAVVRLMTRATRSEAGYV